MPMQNQNIISNNNNKNLSSELNSNQLNNIINILGTIKNKQDELLSDMKYNEINPEFNKSLGSQISQEWSKDYIILDTNKWQVPLQRPPVCINNSPCRVCPIDSASYPLDLLQWQTSNNITNNEPKINKKWVADQ